MSDILLAKSNLDADVIDAAVGEAHIVRDTFLSIFDISGFDLPPANKIWEYQEPQGYKPLIKLLEDRYQAPVIICNGAKQGLGSCFYALKQLGKSNLGVKMPYWALIPPLMEMHGLSFQSNDLSKIDSYLDVSPNNPDGHMSDLKFLSEVLSENKIPFIHDAAYYTHTYLPSSYNLDVFGDAQIYSISKMFGFSSLRLGFVVCKNPEFYKLIKYYMENMTVGGLYFVSNIFI
jgi:aspartate/methionine/tyrosine aminotransferase